jgi:hypothetical protein
VWRSGIATPLILNLGTKREGSGQFQSSAALPPQKGPLWMLSIQNLIYIAGNISRICTMHECHRISCVQRCMYEPAVKAILPVTYLNNKAVQVIFIQKTVSLVLRV